MPDGELKMRHTHDCTVCVPMGQYREFDLYFCNSHGTPTVVARYGSDGPQYLSGIPLARYGSDGPQYLSGGIPLAGMSPELGIAKAMAEGLKLLEHKK